MADKIVNNAGKILETGANLATSGISDFTKLIKDFNVIGFVLGLLIANSVAEIANSFIDGLIMPTIKPMIEKIGDDNAEYRLGNFKFHPQKFIKALMKFLVLAVVIYALLQFGVAMTKPVQWVKIVDIKDGIKL